MHMHASHSWEAVTAKNGSSLYLASSAMLCSQLNLFKDAGKVEQNDHSKDFTWEAGVAVLFPTQVQRPIA